MALTMAEVARDYETDGVPSSGSHKIKKGDLRNWGAWVEGLINAFTANGGLIFSSKAALDASLAYAANTMAWVIGDATVANNGIYRKIGASGVGSWTRVSDLPFSFIIASDAGAGTPNAIQATTSIPVSSSALVWMNVFEANTASPVTVSFNGGSALTIKTNSGNDVAVGGLTAGMIVMGIVSGSTFRLVSDQASAAIVAQAEAAATEAEYWANQAALASGIPVGAKVVFAERLGVIPGTDVTAAAKALYDGLSNAIVIWSPGTYDLTDYILVNGDNVTSWCPAGRDAINIRQKTWGLPCFSTADPTNTSVRPNGVRFLDMGFEAWNGSTKCYFHDAFYGPGSSGPYTCSADLTTTADEVYLFRNLALENPASVSGLGTSTVTLTLATPQLATDYISIKVTNKDDLYGSPSLWFGGVNQKASDSAAVFHGGGDGFVFERCRAEGFVCPVSCWGDWTSNAAGRQSYNARIYDVTFDNCDFILFTEIIDGYVDRIIGGKVAETQTDAGMTIGVEATYKDPHVIYVTDTSTLATTENLHVGILQGDNKYSSNYKFRNCRGLKVDGGSAPGYFRHLDIEACSNSALNFNTLGGAFNDARDNQRAVFNLYGCTGVTINVERLYLTSDITRIARFRYGRTFGSGGAQSVCGQCVVYIKECFITATAARSATLDWITNHGGVDCKVIIDKLYILGEMPNYLYRAREDDGGAGIAASRGGLVVKEIVATATNPNLKLASIASGAGGHPANMRVEVGKRTSVGGVWDANTFNDVGTGNRIIVDGQERITLSAVVCSFATNGDAVFTPSNFTYDAVREGDYVEIDAAFSLATSAFTTASGAFEIRFAGMPTPSTDRGEWGGNVVDLRGVDLGTTTRHLGARLNSAGNYITIRETGDDNSGGTVAATAFAAAGASDYVVALKIRYRAA